MLTSKQRAFLRSRAMTIQPVYQVGKGGFSEESIRGINEALARRELIKVHVLENSAYSRKEAGARLAEACECECVQVIGSKVTLFKQKEKESKFDLKNLVTL